MPQSKSSKRWLQEHFSDEYVKKAQKQGYRARAAFKLLEIQEKDRLIKPGMVVVDLGSAPGGWSQVIIELIKNKGKIFACDILPMEPIDGVEFIQGDFREESIVNQLFEKIEGQKVDVVLSDIAPNIGGIKAVDQARSMYLAGIVLEFAKKVLVPGGSMLIKVFQGAGFDEYLKKLRQHFKKVVSRKPKASRDRSNEIYLLAKGFK